MAYKATIQLYLMFVAAMLVAAIVTRSSSRSRVISSAIAWGLIGSAIGFALAPPLAVLAGFIPDDMVAPEYFTRPFLGCIAPSAIISLFITSASGVLGCFGAGVWLGLRRRRTHVA